MPIFCVIVVTNRCLISQITPGFSEETVKLGTSTNKLHSQEDELQRRVEYGGIRVMYEMEFYRKYSALDHK